MAYIVPQFIEREPKIVGPFTFKQFIYVGMAGGISIFLYFMVSFSWFLLAAIVLMGSAFALAFFKKGGFPLPQLILNFFIFLTRPRLYLWRKKTILSKISRKAEKPGEEKEELTLKVSGRSRLRDLSARLETSTK